MTELIDMRPGGRHNTELIDLIESLNTSSITMIEIGSYRGQSAEIFLSTGKVQKIYCIDPWLGGYDNRDGASNTDMQLVEADFDTRIGNDPRVYKFKGTIDQFIESNIIEPGDIDLVYIDALHTYDGCKHDIEVVMDKMIPNLAISGHDYNNGWDGVRKAVDEKFDNVRIFGFSWLKTFG